MNARIEVKYPDQKWSYKVVVMECPLCGARVEEDYDERFHTPEHLEYMGREEMCKDCTEVGKSAPGVLALVKRLVENRLATKS